MAEHVGSAVVGEAVSTAASFLTDKYEELTGVSDKTQRLKWKVRKIQSAIEESNKYDIENEALRQMLQEIKDVELEARQVLQELDNASSAAHSQLPNQAVAVQNLTVAPDTQRLDQAVAVQNPTINEQTRLCDIFPLSSTIASLFYKLLSGMELSFLLKDIAALTSHLSGVLVGQRLLGARLFSAIMKMKCGIVLRHYGQDLILRMREIQKLNRILERVEGISGDINDFLEMLRHQKRKRERRRRYRPYKGFFMLAYLELAQDALGYWWARISWMQFLVPEFAAFVETKSEFGLNAGGTKLSGVSKYCFML